MKRRSVLSESLPATCPDIIEVHDIDPSLYERAIKRQYIGQNEVFAR